MMPKTVTEQPHFYSRNDSVLMKTYSKNKTGREHNIYFHFYLKPIISNITQENLHLIND